LGGKAAEADLIVIGRCADGKLTAKFLCKLVFQAGGCLVVDPIRLDGKALGRFDQLPR
jgi:hypothetical protein